MRPKRRGGSDEAAADLPAARTASTTRPHHFVVTNQKAGINYIISSHSSFSSFSCRKMDDEAEQVTARHLPREPTAKSSLACWTYFVSTSCTFACALRATAANLPLTLCFSSICSTCVCIWIKTRGYSRQKSESDTCSVRNNGLHHQTHARQQGHGVFADLWRCVTGLEIVVDFSGGVQAGKRRAVRHASTRSRQGPYGAAGRKKTMPSPMSARA